MQETFNLRGVLNCNIFDVWSDITPFINAALEHADNKYTLMDIQIAIIKKEMQLWVIVDSKLKIHAVMITEVIQYPNKKVLLITLLSGVNFDNWKHLLNQLKQFANELSCSSIETYGRHGWIKKLEPLGFTQLSTHYSLPIDGD